LLAAQHRGVRVQLVLDTFGQRLGGVLMTRADRRVMAAACRRLTAAGGSVRFYRPPRFVQRWLGGGHHFKVQVSEAGAALVSSGNVTKSSFDGWNECALAVRGPVVGRLMADLRAVGAEVPDADLAAVSDAAGEITLDYWFCNPNDHQGPLGVLGWRGTNVVTQAMIDLLASARQSVVMTSFYFKPAPALMTAVLDAARRGVRVEVFHSHCEALPATDLAWIASAVDYPRLLEAGVSVYENRRGEHSKIVLVDDARVAIGSYNFEDAAHDRLAEAMLATGDAAVLDPVRAIVDRLRTDADTTVVTRDTIAAWPDRTRRRVRWFGRFKRWL
jgi:phosphatidylserine/phosphatidylglycerophosphate/cardiolipin synthase-like enzyme